MNIRDFVAEHENIWAHISEDNEKREETLEEHSDLVYSYYEELRTKQSIEDIIHNIIEKLIISDTLSYIEEMKSLVRECFDGAILLHDIGKVNPAFQRKRMKNQEVVYDEKWKMSSHHSLLSSLVYLHIFGEKIESLPNTNVKQKKVLRHIAFVCSYIISRHHTYLNDIESEESESLYFQKLEDLLEEVKERQEYVRYYKQKEDFLSSFSLQKFTVNKREKNVHEPFVFFTLTKLLYSILVSCDFYATYTYQNEKRIAFRGFTEESKKVIRKKYEATGIYQGIQAYKKDYSYFGGNNINSLRSDMFLESEAALLKQKDENLFYLEAPTGSGKTNMSLNLSTLLLGEQTNLNKVLYVFPFNTLIEQTKERIQEITNEYAIINSIAPILSEKELAELEKNEQGYCRAQAVLGEVLLQRQTIQSPITLTSHVNLFQYFFDHSRESNLGFVHLCNSVVILDEIQSYKTEIWLEMIRFLDTYASLLNIKVIIMSATLPNLNTLLEANTKQVCLLSDTKKYYQHTLFKERVQLNFDALSERMKVEEIIDMFLRIRKQHGKKKYVVLFISKKSARTFYQLLLEKEPAFQDITFELTGDDSIHNRTIVLEEVQKREDVILVTTPVIEAGVDIDMDVGMKDISLLDAEEQFLGRINRSAKKMNCIAYFFNCDEARRVYHNSYKVSINQLAEREQRWLVEKDFTSFYSKTIENIVKEKESFLQESLLRFHQNVKRLSYQTISNNMKLIENNTVTLYFPYEITLPNGNVLNGKSVWKDFQNIIENKTMSYTEKQIRLSFIRSQMACFTYSVYKEEQIPHTEKIGNYFYIEKWEEFVEYDQHKNMYKFAREKIPKKPYRFLGRKLLS